MHGRLFDLLTKKRKIGELLANCFVSVTLSVSFITAVSSEPLICPDDTSQVCEPIPRCRAEKERHSADVLIPPQITSWEKGKTKNRDVGVSKT